MLIGRGPEQERIEALFTNARRGQGGGLVLRGEAGVGKTELLHYGVERADGMQLLRARGIESEAELAFSGLLELRPDPGTRDDLTPQELTVAMRVAEGMSNREAAAALFVSPKTIEAHLGRAYRKLGIRSRGELTRLFAGGPVVAAEFAQRTPGKPFASAAKEGGRRRTSPAHEPLRRRPGDSA